MIRSFRKIFDIGGRHKNRIIVDVDFILASYYIVRGHIEETSADVIIATICISFVNPNFLFILRLL